MKEVEVIKARNDLQTRTRGKTIELMRVGAYCRVSTDSADQLNSYKSQVAYYTDMIKKNKEWVLADIYADDNLSIWPHRFQLFDSAAKSASNPCRHYD